MSFEDIGIDFHLFIVCVSLYTFPFSSILSIIMYSGAGLSGVFYSIIAFPSSSNCSAGFQ